VPARADDPRRLIRYAVAVLLGGLLTVVVLYQLRHVILLLYVSTILAIGFSPAVHWVEQRRLSGRQRRTPRWVAILMLYAGALGVFALILAILIPPVVAQTRQLWTQVPGYVDMAQARLESWGLAGGDWTWRDLAERVQGAGISSVVGAGLSGVLGAVQSVLGGIAAFVTVVLLPFYLLVEAETLQKALLRLVAPERRNEVRKMTADVTLKVGAWLTGQLMLAFVIGTTATLALWIIGVPYFYVFGVIAAIGELIPVLGPLLAAIPAVLVAFTVSPATGVIVAAFFGAQQFVENNILVPRIMKSQVGISAVTVLIALLVGSALLGVVGALLAVPSAAIFQVVAQEYLMYRDTDS